LKSTNFVSMAVAIAVNRISLGIVLLVGGWKLAFPADPQGLVASYKPVPESGWNALDPLFVDWIQSYFPVDILGFLNGMGWLEMTVGLALLLGILTPWFAGLAGLMFLSFAMANPEAGMVRLALDVSMAGFSFAIAYAGSGRWSLDSITDLYSPQLPSRRNWYLSSIRVAVLYSFVLAVFFPLGVGMNPLNTTLPWVVVLVITILLLFPGTARWVTGVISLWMIVLVAESVWLEVAGQGFSGIYWGLDAAKRQVGLFGATLAYCLFGPDDLSIWPPGKPGSNRGNNTVDHETNQT